VPIGTTVSHVYRSKKRTKQKTYQITSQRETEAAKDLISDPVSNRDAGIDRAEETPSYGNKHFGQQQEWIPPPDSLHDHAGADKGR